MASNLHIHDRGEEDVRFGKSQASSWALHYLRRSVPLSSITVDYLDNNCVDLPFTEYHRSDVAARWELRISPSAILRAMDNRSFSDAGGTPGGLAHFALGSVMACIGGYLLVNQVTVMGSYWNFHGENAFGITLLPMLFGIGLLFWRGRSIAGWVLTIAGALFIFAGIIANLHIYFRPLSLFNTIVMLVLLVGGLGLIARGIQPHGKRSDR